mmetsp:Transcript_12371/g.29062  ORF Transcript_12371/g.29062 Transcript_12371/m.29062 type:complete len:660 (-) Transcript_12371:127-2106(-)|eukprot:CAMPEP_0178437288 /NCGR_PEP_ID=MMETSP0689_2-20121128/34905_1 /TAXON_ID=160604 /ORGANISM="Amphidinium massartii, Strain CS-259" /LENGTH=659 /DNA_ID=CAMNT_0020059465 /DNA_START=22 /DNA_END=2001 /DNA_ORIENTATION=+
MVCRPKYMCSSVSALENGPGGFTVLERLGAGGAGKVVKAAQKFTNAHRAVKVISRRSREERDPKVEAMVMATFDHPNLVKLHATCEDGNSIYLVLGLCAGGCLFDRPELACQTELNIAGLMEQIFRPLRYLHKMTIVHGDLVPANIMLQYAGRLDSNTVQLADFGLTCRSTESFRDLEATSRLMQALLQQSTILGMTVGSPRVAGKRLARSRSQVEVGAFTKNGAPLDVSGQGMDLMEKLLLSNRGKYSAGQALRHPWILRDRDSNPRVSLSAPALAALERVVESITCFAGFSRLKQCALHILAEELDGPWIATLRELFLLLDCNYDGSVSAPEIRRGVTRLSLSVPEDFSKVLIDIDSDSVGALDYSMFIAAMLEPQAYNTNTAARTVYQSWLGVGSAQLTHEGLAQCLDSRHGSRIFSAEDVRLELGCTGASTTVTLADVQKVLRSPSQAAAGEINIVKADGRSILDSGNAGIPKRHWAETERAALRQSKWEVWGAWQSAAKRAVAQERRRRQRRGSASKTRKVTKTSCPSSPCSRQSGPQEEGDPDSPCEDVDSDCIFSSCGRESCQDRESCPETERETAPGSERSEFPILGNNDDEEEEDDIIDSPKRQLPGVPQVCHPTLLDVRSVPALQCGPCGMRSAAEQLERERLRVRMTL